ncbi:MAG: hypothetical protein ACYC9S_09670 [Leptospirales bacterium]
MSQSLKSGKSVQDYLSAHGSKTTYRSFVKTLAKEASRIYQSHTEENIHLSIMNTRVSTHCDYRRNIYLDPVAVSSRDWWTIQKGNGISLSHVYFPTFSAMSLFNGPRMLDTYNIDVSPHDGH